MSYIHDWARESRARQRQASYVIRQLRRSSPTVERVPGLTSHISRAPCILMSTTALPKWLSATWCRSYIRRMTAEGVLGERNSSVSVRYLQTLADGHAFDLRIANDFALPEKCTGLEDLNEEHLQLLASGAIEAFAGVTTAEAGDGEWTLAWHAAFSFPPLLGATDDPQSLLSRIAAGEHETDDVGRAVPTLPDGRRKPVTHWLEHAPDGSYEEEWLTFEQYFAQGAHLAALRPASGDCGTCWLAILGSTFAFVRDIDRRALPAVAQNRPMAEVLADDAIPVDAKRKLLDCEFSFGRFGQNGGVGGVVEATSLPWCKGVALAVLIGVADAWVPVRPSDAPVLTKAIDAIRADHEKACAELRAAEENGQAGIADMLRARGAVA